MDGSDHSISDVQRRGIYRERMAFCKGAIPGDLIQINFGSMLVLENVSAILVRGFVEEAEGYQPREPRNVDWLGIRMSDARAL